MNRAIGDRRCKWESDGGGGGDWEERKCGSHFWRLKLGSDFDSGDGCLRE